MEFELEKEKIEGELMVSKHKVILAEVDQRFEEECANSVVSFNQRSDNLNYDFSTRNPYQRSYTPFDSSNHQMKNRSTKDATFDRSKDYQFNKNEQVG